MSKSKAIQIIRTTFVFFNFKLIKNILKNCKTQTKKFISKKMRTHLKHFSQRKQTPSNCFSVKIYNLCVGR